MPDDSEKIEEELRSAIYTALVELSLSAKSDKAAIAQRLNAACSELHDLIIYGRIPKR